MSAPRSAVLEDTRRAALDYQSGQRQRRARELQVGLREVVEVEVTIATGPDELPWDEIALLCEQVREQPVARDVERYAEEHIGAALVDLAGQPPRRHVELKERVARHEPHALELTHVPGAHQDAP